MQSLLREITSIATRAGKEILQVYRSEFDVDYKSDGSPLTLADRRAHECIVDGLSSVDSKTPILSEESVHIDYSERRQWSRFWLVDPLDGTKEFVNRSDEFTVNIALIENGKPILGVVHAPVSNVTYSAAVGVGVFRSNDNGETSIATRQCATDKIAMVLSRSHSVEMDQYKHKLQQRWPVMDTLDVGSSLKFCLLAEGRVDIYPRLKPTSEWDTAAAHCVLRVAGGEIVDLDGNPLIYNKPNILNPYFLAFGDTTVDWLPFFVPLCR